MASSLVCPTCGNDRSYWTISYCRGCWAKRSRHYRAKNPEAHRLATNSWRSRNKDKVVAQNNRSKSIARLKSRRTLGTCCECCGERRESMLDIDHRHGGGSIERRKYGPSLVHRELRTMANPHEKYQLLCSNCNQSRRRLCGECEHLAETVELMECMSR